MSGKALFGLRDSLFCGLVIIMIGSPLRAQITEYPAPFVSLSAIAAGPDGAMWFTEYSNNTLAKIGRITTSGVFTEYALPNPASEPTTITEGPDGALWFIEAAHLRHPEAGQAHESRKQCRRCRRLGRRRRRPNERSQRRSALLPDRVPPRTTPDKRRPRPDSVVWAWSSEVEWTATSQ